MTALSIRQPWAWLIAHGWKDVENRTWKNGFRGWFAIHAARAVPKEDELVAIEREYTVMIPRGELCYGGLIGTAWLKDCVRESKSRWFEGPYGFVIERAEPMPFIPVRGSLWFFELRDEIEVRVL